MLRLTFIFISLLSFSGGVLGDAMCEWDNLKKNIWFDDLDQQGVRMAYPLPHDLISRQLAPALLQLDKHIIENPLTSRNSDAAHNARQKAQILISAKLLFSDFINEARILGLGLSDHLKITLKITLTDNFSQTPIKSFTVDTKKRIWLNPLQKNQQDLHDYAVKMITHKIPEIAELIDSELDCVPFATKIISTSGKEWIMQGGGNNNIKPNMTFSVMGYKDPHSENIIYNKIATIKTKAVSPNTSTAVSSENMTDFYQGLFALYPPPNL